MLKNLTPALVRAIAVFAVTFVISIIIATISYMYMDDIYQDQQSAKREMQKWQVKLNSSIENSHIIEEFESNCLNLVNQGVVVDEDRISWFETIQNTAKKRGMPLVKYSISTQQVLKEANLKRDYKGIDVFKSSMTLDAKMAHEGDLFALLNDLSKADGLYTVDKCKIEKINNKNTDTNNTMKAFCELGWYTFRGTKTDKVGSNAG